ncbi:polysaccharide deacetylase family protein [Paenibacillus sp. y28]|uniref:polysaccharide deacetylase family protein n=1 Tax=Paenibacillus sp. y28 TaxID=3129110 RepID=UPI003019A422
MRAPLQSKPVMILIQAVIMLALVLLFILLPAYEPPQLYEGAAPEEASSTPVADQSSYAAGYGPDREALQPASGSGQPPHAQQKQPGQIEPAQAGTAWRAAEPAQRPAAAAGSSGAAVDNSGESAPGQRGGQVQPQSAVLAAAGPELTAALQRPKPDYSKQARHYRNKAIVLVYHHIDPKENGITISRERFHNQLQMLRDNGYNIITMEQFVAFMSSKGEVPQNAVLITFDDGYESFYTQAYPELLQFGFPATKFVVVDSIDNPPAKGTPRLNWDQMREMKRNGMSFYSHTNKLHEYVKADQTLNLKPALANRMLLDKENRLETEEEYRERVKTDLIRADRRLEDELGIQERLLAFPFGAYNETALQIGRELGIGFFFTTAEGINVPGKDEIYRINAGVNYLSADGLLKRLKKYENASS